MQALIKTRPAAIILGVALAFRLMIALSFPNIIAVDEVYQFLEQAHRLVFGQGIVPWEFQVGLRCWLIPLLLAGLMAPAHVLFGSPLAGLVLIRIVLCIASLPIVGCAAAWGKRFYGTLGLWVAGGLAALWPDLWLMAPHALEEVLAADALVPAIYLISTPRTKTDLRRAALAGFLLGLAFTFRIQLGPAIALAGIALCQRDIKLWRVALLAAALPVLAAGMLDWVTWGQPFRSFWLNIYLNLALGIAKGFGEEPPGYFIFMLGLDWLWSFPVMLALIWLGARRLPAAGAVLLVIVLMHSLIAHKELRFIFPALALAVPLAGLGLSAAMAALWQSGRFVMLRGCALVFLMLGPLFSPWLYFLLQLKTDSFGAFESVSDPSIRLVSVQGMQEGMQADGAVFIPIDLMFSSASRLTRQTFVQGPGGVTEADAIVARENAAGIPPAFHLKACFEKPRVPFSGAPGITLCSWVRAAEPSQAETVLPFELPFPAAAKPFIVSDRLSGG